MSSQILLSGGDKYYSYSGEIFGDVTAPASINMITIDNTGLRDSYVQIQPFLGKPTSDGDGDALGFEVKLDNITVFNAQGVIMDRTQLALNPIMLFVPRNSKLQINSLNTTNNNTQIRGCNVLGYYL
jgi:hypothetical protein